MKRQRGVIALELALILPTVLTLLAVVLYFGLMTYHYQVAQKAAGDGARYLSTVPAVNLRSFARGTAESNLTMLLVQSELDALSAGATVYVACDDLPCGALTSTAPSQVTVTVLMPSPNIFPAYGPDLPDQQLVISRRMRYAGN